MVRHYSTVMGRHLTMTMMVLNDLSMVVLNVRHLSPMRMVRSKFQLYLLEEGTYRIHPSNTCPSIIRLSYTLIKRFILHSIMFLGVK